jgi:amino acid transporter
MLGVTVVTAGTTFNGGFVAASRLLYALGRSRHLPPGLAHLNGRFVPDRALWLLWAVAVVLTLAVFASGRYLVLINAGATLECAMYVVAALALMGMRRRRPDLLPSWSAPGGRVLPWATVALFGLLGIGAATAPSGLPLPAVPWTLLLLGVLTVGALLYTRHALRRRGGLGGGRTIRA